MARELEKEFLGLVKLSRRKERTLAQQEAIASVEEFELLFPTSEEFEGEVSILR